MYTVDQEGVTADEKKTDIRMRATRSEQQAVIELKIGDKPRPATELRKAIETQLLKKYMAPNESRAGCLLITIRSNKTWAQPGNRKKLDFASLIKFLSDEAEHLSIKLGGSVRLLVKGLDLRPRLTTERLEVAGKKARKAAKTTAEGIKRRNKAGRTASSVSSTRRQQKLSKDKAKRQVSPSRRVRRHR